jgi:hypothetical protein
MSDKITEVAKQAHFTIYASPMWNNTGERFAKMLINECAVVVQDLVDHRVPASEYPDRLRQHFGIDK